MVKFGFFSKLYFTHPKRPILNLIFHSYNTKSVKPTLTFSHKIKLTYLTVNNSEK